MSLNLLKIALVSSIVTLLPGCALLDAYFMAKYDTNEYNLMTEIRTIAETQQSACENSQGKIVFDMLVFKSTQAANFTQYIPDNEDAHKLSNNVLELAKQGQSAYEKSDNVSPAFCKLKLKQIQRTAETSQKVLGSKPR
jgi:hypothetical protein